MDRLFSLIGLYELLALILPGGLAVSGTYWAIAGTPSDVSVAAALAIVGGFFIAGNLVQAAAVLWEKWYWRAAGGWPSIARMNPESRRAFEAPVREFILDGLVKVTDDSARGLPTRAQFAIARAKLREWSEDGRSETMNVMYGLARGLATASAYLAIVFVWSALVGEEFGRNVVANWVSIGATGLFLVRFHRFGFYFADQVWTDFASRAGRET